MVSKARFISPPPPYTSPSLLLSLFLLWRCQILLHQFVRTSAWKLEQRITHVTRLAGKYRRQRHWLKMTRGVSPCQGERNGSLESTPPMFLGNERPVHRLLTMAGSWSSDHDRSRLFAAWLRLVVFPNLGVSSMRAHNAPIRLLDISKCL